jgi:hypothetical protein
MDEIEGGNQYKNSIYANAEYTAEATVGDFMNDLKKKNLLDIFKSPKIMLWVFLICLYLDK